MLETLLSPFKTLWKHLTWLRLLWAYVILTVVVLGGQMFYTYQWGERAAGEITGFTQVRGSRYPEITFTAQANEQITFTAPFSFATYETGEQVEVAYRSSEPQEAFMLRPLWHEVYVWIMGVLLAFLIWRTWRKTRPKPQ